MSDDWQKDVDEKSWSLVGKFQDGELLLANRRNHVSVMYRWTEKGRIRRQTLSTFFLAHRYARALRDAKAEIRAEKRRNSRP